MNAPLLLVALIVTTLLPLRDAHAYLDPGTGSILLQALVGGVAGLVVAWRLSWRRIAAVFHRNKGFYRNKGKAAE